MITYAFDLDIVPGGVPVVVPLKQYEDDVVLSFNVYSRLGTLNLPSGTSVSIRGTKPDGNGFSSDTGVTFSNNVVTVNVDKQMTAAAGKSLFELVFTNNNKELITTSFVILVQRAALDKDTLASASVIKELVNIIDRTDEIIAAANLVDEANESFVENASAARQSIADAVANAQNYIQNTQRIIDDKADEVGAILDGYYDDLQDAQLVMEAKVDGAYVEDGYLYLTSDGSIVAGPLGPFSGTGGGSGGGGGGGSVLYTISLVNTMTSRAITVAEGSLVEIQFTYESIDSDGEDDGDGVGSLFVDGAYAGTYAVRQGNNSINITKHLRAGNNRIKFTVENSEGNSRSLSYTANIVSLSMTTTMNDIASYSGQVVFNYTPVGSGTKIVHYVMDGVEIGTEEVMSSGRSRSYTIPEQTHGGHTFECYATMTVNGVSVTSNVIKLGMIFVSSSSTSPAIIATANKTSVEQGETVQISYMVFSPTGEFSNVSLKVIDGNGSQYSSQEVTVDRTKQTWNLQDYPNGNVVFRISSGSTNFDVSVEVTEYTLPVEPVTDGLVLEFGAYGRSNAEENPAQWSFENIEAEFSGFGWSNADGWMSDVEGSPILRFLPGDYMVIPLKIFETDARETGYTIEAEFATRDVRDYESIVLSCADNGRGISIASQEAKLSSEQSEVSMLFKEDSKVRVSFVIERSNLNRLVYIYINGIMCGATQYPISDNFAQVIPQNITIGSETCGIDLYKIRCYRKGLTRAEQLDNYIVDRTTLRERQDAVARNDILDQYDEVVFSKLPVNLPYIIVECEEMPQYKGDKKTGVNITFVDKANTDRSWTASGAEIDVQGTSSAGYPVKNEKIKLKEGITYTSSGTTDVGFPIFEGSIPTKVICLKVDYASSEGANNVMLTDYYNELCPYKTPPQVANAKVRQGIEGFACALFWKNSNTSEVVFIGKCNLNTDKSNHDIFGFTNSYPAAQSWEFRNNTSNRVLFKTSNFGNGWEDDFEARYPEDNTNTNNFKRLTDWLASTDRDAAGLTEQQKTERLTKFKNEAANYLNVNAIQFYYLFTETFLMVDSRAKNMFMTTYDGTHWFSLPYDMDTAIGINNEGALVFDYDLEDYDKVNGANVFNGQDSVLWKNVRDAYPNELQAMYSSLRSSGKFSYETIKDKMEKHQSVWPEALWNEDAFNKYLQPFLMNGENYLSMLQGSKESQRDWWLFNAFRYRDSKYQCGDASANFITLRCYAVGDITVTPYSHIWPRVKFGSSTSFVRGKRNQSYVMECQLDNMDDTEVYIYSADRIASVGSLHHLQVGYANFSMATKLQSIVLGSSDEGYTNRKLEELYVGNNELLTMVNIENCVNLTMPIDLSGCASIETVKAKGSSITGVSLPNGGHLETLELPATITNFTIQNQKELTNLEFEGYDSIATLRVEGTPNVPIEELINSATSLNRVRLVDVEWEAESEETLATTINKLKTCIGMDANGGNTENAVVIGRVNVSSISASLFTEISESFPNLVVVVNNVPQYVITFMNYDGEVLHRSIVSEGANVVDPVTAGSISTPTRQGSDEVHYVFSEWSSLPTNVHTNQSVVAQFTESYRVRYMNGDTVLQTNYIVRGNNATYSGSNPTKAQTAQYTYTFNGWLGTQTNITSSRDFIAQFTSTVRTYTVRFYNGSTLLQTSQVAYGSNAQYTGTTPVYSGTETNDYGAFTGWVPSNMTITGATDFVAEFEYTGSLVKNYLEQTLASFEDNEITTIRDRAFLRNENLRSVSSTSVLSVGDNAFETYKSAKGTLEDVYLPNVTSIGMYAFSYQKMTGNVNLQSVVTVGKCALRGTTFYPNRIVLPSATTIGDNAFEATSCRVIDLPSATTIGYAAFRAAPSTLCLLLRNTEQVCAYNSTTSSDDPGTGARIYVPRALLDSYKTATNWSRVANKFVALEDNTVDGTTTGEIIL